MLSLSVLLASLVLSAPNPQYQPAISRLLAISKDTQQPITPGLVMEVSKATGQRVTIDFLYELSVAVNPAMAAVGDWGGCQPNIDLHIEGQTTNAKVGEHVEVNFSATTASTKGAITPLVAIQATILYDPTVLAARSMTFCGSPLTPFLLWAPMQGIGMCGLNDGYVPPEGGGWPDPDGDMQTIWFAQLGTVEYVYVAPTLLWTMTFEVIGTGDATVRVTQIGSECCPDHWLDGVWHDMDGVEMQCSELDPDWLIDEMWHTRILGTQCPMGNDVGGDLSSFAEFNISHPADMNGDGIIGIADFLAFLAAWVEQESP